MNSSDQPKAGQLRHAQIIPETDSDRVSTVHGEVVRINSTQLFGRAKEIEINHNGKPYRLRQTALGKLILTK